MGGIPFVERLSVLGLDRGTLAVEIGTAGARKSSTHNQADWYLVLALR